MVLAVVQLYFNGLRGAALHSVIINDSNIRGGWHGKCSEIQWFAQASREV